MEFTQMLTQNHEFRRLYSKGASVVTPFMVVYCRHRGSGTNRLGITVSAKIGNAVTRNKIRRRLKEIYRLSESRLRPGFDIVVVARFAAVEAPYKKLESTFFYAAKKLSLLRSEDSL